MYGDYNVFEALGDIVDEGGFARFVYESAVDEVFECSLGIFGQDAVADAAEGAYNRCELLGDSRIAEETVV